MRHGHRHGPGALAVTSSDGRRRVDNGLWTRLDRAERLLRGAVAAVESALRRALVRTFDHIRSIAPDEPRRLLEVQLQCWDADAVRAIVRGVARAGAPARIKEAVLSTGLLTDGQIEELVSQPDIVAVSDPLVTWDYAFAAPLRHAIRDDSAVEKGILEFGSTQRLASIERFLEMSVLEAVAAPSASTPSAWACRWGICGASTTSS